MQRLNIFTYTSCEKLTFSHVDDSLDATDRAGTWSQYKTREVLTNWFLEDIMMEQAKLAGVGSKQLDPLSFSRSFVRNAEVLRVPGRQIQTGIVSARKLVIRCSTSREKSWHFQAVSRGLTGSGAAPVVAPHEWKVSNAPGFSLLGSERIKVAAMLAMGMGLCNAIRVIMSVAIVPLSAAHNWSSGFAGIVQSSFLWGYLLSPIPGGALADRYGGKSVMGWGVFFWSLATLATPWAASRSLNLLLAVRAFMGLAEGVAMPSMNNIVSRWFPSSERAKAVAITMGGFHLGNVCGLLLTPLLMARFGIDGPFYAFGAIGLLWLISWFSFSNDPQGDPLITRSELRYIQNGIVNKDMNKPRAGLPPFRMLLSSSPCLAIILANAMNNFGYFIVLTWMPIYFNTVLGVNLKQAAWFSAVPWATMAVAGYFAGTLSDSMISSGAEVGRVRKLMQSIGFIGPAAAIIGLNATRNPAVASVWLTIAVALSSFSQAGYLVNYQEIAPEYAGVLHGMSNTAGTLGAILSTAGTGFLVQWFGSFQAVLILTSVMYCGCTLFWNTFSSGKRVFG